MAGEIDLLGLTYLYSKSSLFIGGDTGPMHLAASQNTPIIALMGPTDPKRNGPYNKNSIVIQKNIKCKNCWSQECPYNNECMGKISVDEVYKTASNLWSEK